MSSTMSFKQIFTKKQAMHSLESCEKLMEEYYYSDGECVTLKEGNLGLGLVLCYGENLKTTIINEVYLNRWSSGYTIRMYNKMPEKYKKMLENFWNREEE